MAVEKVEDVFSKYFQVVRAVSTQDVESAYRIRHQVYCEDLGWYEKRDNGLFFDAADNYSIQLLLRHRETKRDVGCVRLVKGNPGPLPIAAKCDGSFMDAGWAPSNQSKASIGEMTHLAIISEYRRRRGENKVPVGGSMLDSKDKPRYAWILMGLYMSAFAYARRERMNNLYVLTDSQQAKQLNAMGVVNKIIGLSIRDNGSRVPVMMDIPWVIDNLDPRAQAIFDHIQADMDRS